MSFIPLQLFAFIFSILFSSNLIYTLVYNKNLNNYGDILYEFSCRKLQVMLVMIQFSFIGFMFLNPFKTLGISLTTFLLCWFFTVAFLLCIDNSTERLVVTSTGVGFKNYITGIQRDDFIEWDKIEHWDFEEQEEDILHLKLPDTYPSSDKYLVVPKREQKVLMSLFNTFCH